MNQDESMPMTVVPPETIQDGLVKHTASPLSVSQVKAGLIAIHEVMRDCMKEGQDYGKVPGCGDKPGLFQPGAQKLSMMFQLNPEVRQETITDYANYHRGYRLIVRVTSGAKYADGIGECSTLENKYRFRSGSAKCPDCGKETVFKSKNGPEKWYCWTKKGGCGAKFAADSEGCKRIESQDTGKVEHDNPPDFWNTVRKMAFKRAFVHAIINATNTSELWSQDLEDLAANGVVGSQEAPKQENPPRTPPKRQSAPKGQPEAKEPPSGTPPNEPQDEPKEWREVAVPFGKNVGVLLGDLSEKSLAWYCENIDNRNPDFRKALDEAAAEMGYNLPT